LARRSPVPVELDLRAERRPPEPVEVAVCYAVAEALTNAVKHARASVVHVELDTHGEILRLAIRDDGIGGADPGQGSGLVGLSDRIEALGGTLKVASPASGEPRSSSRSQSKAGPTSPDLGDSPGPEASTPDRSEENLFQSERSPGSPRD
jgi:glucose-6-phosphate-specific signal transduction histidine kinase